MSILIFLIFFSLFLSSGQSNSLYKLPLDLLNQNFIPKIPVYLKKFPSIPLHLSLDINLEESWIFNFSLENNDDKKNKVKVKRGFYMISGFKNKGTIYLNSNLKIKELNYLDVNQIYDEINNPGVLSLNKNLDSNNIINFLFDEEKSIKEEKYFGFCLDFSDIKQNQNYLYMGNLKLLNNNIENLKRFPIYVGDSEEDKKRKKSIWSIKLKGLFIGNINNTNNNNDDKIINHIDNTKNKGLIIEEPALIETIFNYIYIPKEAMLFLVAHYLNDKKDICKREEIKDENTYEIKYNCLRNKRKNLNNINIILENNVTIELTYEDLLNCAINKNINSKLSENEDTCEFLIRYHNNINYYALGLPILRKYRTYFLFNDDSILMENNNYNFSQNYLEEKQFSNISRQKKKSLGETIKGLINTTLSITLIFAALASGFYLYDKYFGKKIYENEEESEKMINRSKYANL